VEWRQAVYSVAVEFFGQTFGLVESIFAAIKVSFEGLFEWLGFLFDGDDILRTRTAVSYWVLGYLKFLEGAAGGMQKIFDVGQIAKVFILIPECTKLLRVVGSPATLYGTPLLTVSASRARRWPGARGGRSEP
jgi:hypothetical protein